MGAAHRGSRRDQPFVRIRDAERRQRRFRLRAVLGLALRFTRSGSFLRPVSRFHSSNVCGEIFPCTRSSANLRRCALLLKGIVAHCNVLRLRYHGTPKSLIS